VRVVAYLRVSTKEQVRKDLSIPAQLERIEGFLTAKGWTLVAVYADEGISAYKRVRRPDFERMMAEIPSLSVGYVVSVAVDRLGRNMRDGLESALRLVDDHGVHIATVNGVDTSAPGGRQALYMSLMMAEGESANTSARVKATYPAMLARKGYKPGGRRKYGRNPDASVNEREANVIRSLIIPCHLAGQSELTISRKLNEDAVPSASGGKWDAGTLSNLLRRPDLANLVRIDDELVEGHLERILDRDVWDRAQEVFALRQSRPEHRGRDPVVPFLLDDPLRVTCGCCGEPMGLRSGKLRKDGTQQASFACLGRERDGVEHGCPMERVPRENVEEMVLTIFERDLYDEKGTLRQIERAGEVVISDTRKALSAADRAVMSLDRDLDVLNRRWRSDEITTDEWRAFSAEITAERAAAVGEAEQLRQRLNQVTGEGALHTAERALLTTIREIRQLAADLRSHPNPNRDLLDAVRAAIARVVEEVVVIDADVGAGYFGAPQLAIGPETRVGDEACVVLALHGIGVKGRRVGIEVVPRRELAVRETVTGNGKVSTSFHPARTPLTTAHNLAFTSQKTSLRPRRRTRSSS